MGFYLGGGLVAAALFCVRDQISTHLGHVGLLLELFNLLRWNGQGLHFSSWGG